MYNILNKYKSAIILSFKLLIIGAALYIISHKISNDEVINSSLFSLYLRTNIFNDYLILISLLSFTIMNWFLEIQKWRSLVSSIKNISFFDALKQSLSSLTASLLTPNRIGEYGVKAIYFPKYERSRILFLNFSGNFIQMFITVLFGSIGLLLIVTEIPFNLDPTVFGFFPFLIGAGIILTFILKNYWMPYWKRIILQIKSISNKIHLHVLILSLLRYLIFSHQFYFLLVVLGADLTYSTSMPIIFIMYFISSLIPGFVIFDWLIKGSVALTLFSYFNVNETLIISITTIMWILNFALPAIIGSYFVMTFNSSAYIFRENRIRS